jgi:Ca2+-transporting ATPase
MAIRSSRDSLFTIHPFSNRALVGAVVFTTLLQLAAVYVPFFQDLLKTTALPLRDLGIAFLASTSLFFVVEIQKWIIRRREEGESGN